MSATLLLYLLGGSSVTAVVVYLWQQFQKQRQFDRAAGSDAEKVRQQGEALDAIKRATDARYKSDVTTNDPERLRDDDGFRRD